MYTRYLYIRQIFLIQMKYRLQSMYIIHMIGRARSIPSPFYFMLLAPARVYGVGAISTYPSIHLIIWYNLRSSKRRWVSVCPCSCICTLTRTQGYIFHITFTFYFLNNLYIKHVDLIHPSSQLILWISFWCGSRSWIHSDKKNHWLAWEKVQYYFNESWQRSERKSSILF